MTHVKIQIKNNPSKVGITYTKSCSYGLDDRERVAFYIMSVHTPGAIQDKVFKENPNLSSVTSIRVAATP
jgi:hypothetical protein